MNTQAWAGYADAEVLGRVRVRLIEPEEKARWDELICTRHYLGNADLVGRQLRYVADSNSEKHRLGAGVGTLGRSEAESRVARAPRR